jgi:hypothetical protein
VLAANFRRALGSLTLAKDLHYLFGIVSFLLRRLVIECYQTNALTGPNSRSHPAHLSFISNSNSTQKSPGR